MLNPPMVDITPDLVCLVGRLPLLSSSPWLAARQATATGGRRPLRFIPSMHGRSWLVAARTSLLIGNRTATRVPPLNAEEGEDRAVAESTRVENGGTTTSGSRPEGRRCRMQLRWCKSLSLSSLSAPSLALELRQRQLGRHTATMEPRSCEARLRS